MLSGCRSEQASPTEGEGIGTDDCPFSGSGQQRATPHLRLRTLTLHAAEFVISLKVKPKLQAIAEALREEERGIRADGAFAMHDFSDVAHRDSDYYLGGGRSIMLQAVFRRASPQGS